MTIAIIMKVNDGLILATDSAATVLLPNEHGEKVVYHVYNHADKIFNLKKEESIACMTWGSGNIGDKSISNIAKDFREDVMKTIDNFTVKGIADKFRNYIQNIISDDDGNVGFIICGYSNSGENDDFPEVYEIQYINGDLLTPRIINEGEPIFISWYGETDYISRLILGFDPYLETIINEHSLDDEGLMEEIKSRLSLPLGVPSMPIQDALEFVETLAYITIQMSKFVPGAQVVGGDIDLAVITKHEKFKWINRKYYYSSELNPKE